MRKRMFAALTGAVLGATLLTTGAGVAGASAPAKAGSAVVYDGRFRLHSNYNDRCLDADLNTAGSNGTKVQLWVCNGGTNQLWDVYEFVGDDGVRYEAFRSAYSGRYLDADLNTIGGYGTRVQLWDYLGGTNQWWAKNCDAYCVFTNWRGGRVLDADLDTIGGNGTRIQLWDDYGAGQLNQHWYFELA